MAIQMTREEYRRQFGTDPIIPTSTLNTKPAPIRMTRAEYDAIYGTTTQSQPGLGSKLVDRTSDVADALWADKPADLVPGRSQLRIAGAIAGAANDVIGAAISPVFNKVVDKISDSSLVQKFATSKVGSMGIDAANSAVEGAQEKWKGFEEANPNVAQDLRDIGNVSQFIPVGKGVSIGKNKILPKVTSALDERTITKRAAEIFDIENNYQKTRTANEYAKDAGAASRARIAATDVLVDAVDTDGTIRTKTPGGAIDKYKAQTIDGFEDVVKRNLEVHNETVSLADVRKALVAEVGRSGLEGGDLVTALRGVDREIAGLKLRAVESDAIGLPKIHDAKISTTKNINYLTPPETATYRKAVARAYKTVVEKNSKKFEVEPVNKELSKYYQDIERLERLDGRKVKGGRLGKYFAQTIGTGIGMGAGAVGGPFGSAVGGAVGAGVAGVLKGRSMAGSFGRATGKMAPKNAILQRAKLSIPDKRVVTPKSIKKTKEMAKIEDDIAKNVEAQNKAIKAGDFTLVAALKEIYRALVDALKAEIAKVRELAKNEGQRGFANFFGDTSQRKNLTMSSQKKAIAPPSKAQSISDTVSQTAMNDRPLSTEAKSYLEKFLAHVDGSEKLPQDEYLKARLVATEIADAVKLESRFGTEKAMAGELADYFTKQLADRKTTVLLEEAKGKSLEEFVRAKYKGDNPNLTYLESNIKKLNDAGIKVNSPDEVITIYHGTNKQGASGIGKTGFNEMSYFATDRKAAEKFVGADGDVIEVKVPVRDLGFVKEESMAGTKGVIIQNFVRLSKASDGVFRANLDDFLSQSQLTDIWKKANNK